MTDANKTKAQPQAADRELLAHKLLQLLNRRETSQDSIGDILRLVKTHLDVEAVGIRLREGDDYPYCQADGFSEDFLRVERYLCERDEAGEIVRDETGTPCLECMCGNVLRGRTDPALPFFTEGGSFWSNNTTQLLATTTEKARQARTRNRCNAEGYESVALIPLRSGGEIIGLLQLNDRRPNRFTLQVIQFFEGLGASIGIALARQRMETDLKRTNRSLVMISECNQALVHATNETDLLNEICRLIVQLGGFRLAWVGYAQEDEKKTVRPVAWTGGDEYVTGLDITWADVERGRGPVGTSIREKRIVFVENVETDGSFTPWRDAAMKYGLRSVISFPLISDGRALGALSIDAPFVDAFTADEIRLLSELAGDMAYGIATLRTRAEHEQARREIEGLARFPGENPSPVLRIAPDGTLLSANRASAQVLAAWEREVGQPVPDDWHRHIAAVSHTGAKAEVKASYGGRTYSFLLVPIAEAGYVNIYSRDITELDQAERYLVASETRYRRLFESSKDGILILDAGTGEIVDVNPYLGELLGFDLEYFLGKKLWEIGLFKDIVASETAFVELQEKEYIRYDGLPLEAKDGRQVQVEFVSNVYRVDSTKVIQCNIRDVTARRSLEEQFRQAQKMEAIGQLAGGVAHDFNNIIMGMMGYTQLIVDRLPKESEEAECAREIYTTAERAAALTRQLLSFSRKQILATEVLDLNTVIDGFQKMLGRLLGEDIDLCIAPAPDLGMVKADPGQIEQVIMNLAVNARDAMPEGGKLTIETGNVDLDEEYAAQHADATPGPHVMLAVSDTGCGMDAATSKKVFEPFFTTKGLDEGTGLGLATVYGIVRQSGGTIHVYSEPGEGTAFKVYLPRIDEAPEVKKPSRPTDTRGAGETILAVEDEETLRGLLVRILERAGYNLLLAANGNEALEVCENHEGTIDLLLTDVVMPEMGGRQLADRLAQTRAEIKVLYMSGYTHDAIAHKGVLASGTQFIQKPFNPNALLAKIREVLEYEHDKV